MVNTVNKDITRARQMSLSLTIFRGVLEDDIGSAFLSLLDSILAENSDAGLVASTYGRLFELLGREQELYSGDQTGDAWQNHLLDRIITDENALSLKADLASWEEIGTSAIEAARF